MKSKHLFSLLFAVTVAFVGCNKDNSTDGNDNLPDDAVRFTAELFDGMHMASRSSDVDLYDLYFSNQDQTISYCLALANVCGEIDGEGYVTVPSGTYKLGDGLTAFTIADYSYYVVVDINTAGYEMLEYEQAELVVTETQSVLTAVIGGVTHVMTYKGSLRLEADLPAAPVEFAASHAYAYYTEGLFKLYLSDLGLDADGNEKANGTYYEFNVNVDKFAPEAKIAIPSGTYDIKSIKSEPGTISGGDYYKLDAEANDVVDSDMIWDGYLTIGENGSVKGECTMFMSGATHTVTYSGEISILESFMPTEPPYSTLKTDKVCDFSNHDIMGMDMGDAHNTGYQTWSISLSGNDSKGDHVVFELLAGEVGKSEIYGKYTVGDSKGSYTAMPGYVDGFTLMNSWYYYKKNTANVTEYAPILSGWVEISKGEDGKITVAFDVYDDLKNHITGSWTSDGPLMKSGESYSKVVL